MSNNKLNKLNEILAYVDFEAEDVSEISVSEFLIYEIYQIKIYDVNAEDFFLLGSLLGEEFGNKNVWIDTYLSTPKYRDYAQIEILVNKIK